MAAAGWPGAPSAWPYTADMAADLSAITLTVVCAAIAGFCGILLVRLWRSGRRRAGR